VGASSTTQQCEHLLPVDVRTANSATTKLKTTEVSTSNMFFTGWPRETMDDDAI
jgi:hypothetical protein